MQPTPRTPFLESADLPAETRWARLARRLLGGRPPRVDPPLGAQGLLDVHTFTPTEEGSGSFGRWIIDADGLPAYDYEIDQHNDPRADYPTSAGTTRRDHWHQVGNRRITAFASNDGVIQVYLCDRGGVILNRFEAEASARPFNPVKAFIFRILRRLIQWMARLMNPQSKQPPIQFFNQAAGAGATNPRGAAPPDLLSRTGGAADFSAQAASPALANDRLAIAGGFSYLRHEGEAWASAYRYRPASAQTRRRFGMGYFEAETRHQAIRITRRVYAPFGDLPALAIDVTLINEAEEPITISHYEYWDINIHQLQLEWMRSGPFGLLSDETRRAINRHFQPGVQYDESAAALRFAQALRQPDSPEVRALDAACNVDWHPAHVFLADLSGTPDACYVDKRAFFGAGGPCQPDAVRMGRGGDPLPQQSDTNPMPYCMVLRRDLTLAPGEQRSLRYAYGTARPESDLGFLDALRAEADPARQTAQQWKQNLAYFTTGEDPVLQRETSWHAYNLLSATVYVDYFRAHIVPQGSAYLYLHGADGAPRDQALFALPAVYLDPPLARDLLRLIMQVTDAHTGQISYAFGGHGIVSDGMQIHTKPSDLDLFFLLALTEYLAATGDYAFLDAEVPFYPPSESPPGATAHDHVRVALRHLLQDLGTGDHGLIKVGSGDWSDSVVLETALRDGPGPFGVTYNNSKLHGESVYNTGMALYVLPLLANLLREHAPDLTAYIEGTPDHPDRHDRLRAAQRAQWNPAGWYNRAILRDILNRPVVLDSFNLEAQPWTLISGDATADGRADALIAQIDAVLDSPSPIGAALTPGGMVWPAVSQLLTWGYARTGRADLAWRSLNRHTFAAHSHTYPDIWLNTWSGPDGVNGISSDLPGGTWTSPVTPMTDFPVMNANQDALALLGLLRVCGIEPAPGGDGLRIRPQVPRERFILDVPLLRLMVEPGRIELTYRPVVDGRRTFTIHHGWPDAHLTIIDPEAESDHNGPETVITVHYTAGQPFTITLTR